MILTVIVHANNAIGIGGGKGNVSVTLKLCKVLNNGLRIVCVLAGALVSLKGF